MEKVCYAFPILKVDDIIAMSGDISLKVEDFKQPTKERWQKFFTVFVCDVIGSTVDTVNNPTLENNFNYPEVHEGGMPIFNLARILQRVLSTCGVEDFKISDIIAPTGKRLVRICSALLNFARFQGERMDTYDQIKQENNALLEQKSVFIRENEEYLRQINEIRAAKAEQQPLLKLIQDETEERKARLAAMHESVAATQKNVSELKASLTEKKNANARVYELVAVAKEESSKLSSQIVSSPDRIMSELDRMQRQLTQVKLTRESRTQNLLEIHQQKAFQEQRDVECNQVLAQVKSISEHNAKQKQIQATQEKMKDESQASRQVLREQHNHLQQKNRLIASKKEKMDKQAIQQNVKAAGMTSALERLVSERKTCQLQDENKLPLLDELHRLREELEAAELTHDNTMDRLKQKYSQLLSALNVYHEELGRSWEG